MLRAFRFCRGGVSNRVLAATALVALLFVSGCASNGGGTPQFTVMTTSAQLAVGTINAAFAQTTLTAANGTAPYTWSMTGSLPAGMTLSPAGVLSGTPTQSGTFSFTVTVKDSATPVHTATANLTLTVDQAPAITSANNTTLTVGTAGTFTVTATGYPAPTFSETGALPAGVTLNSTSGVLSGTPAAGTGGTYSITITAQNGATPNATQSFTLTVNQAPAITSANSTTFTVGAAGTFTVTKTGSPAPTLSENGALPTGVSFNTSTGVLSGTPANGAQGSYPISFTAQNGIGTAATQSFTLTVGLAPAITSANNATFTVGASGTFTVTATGFPTATFSETGALPSGVSLSTAGVLSGTPAANTGGTYPITITAQNGVGTPATQSFTLTVNQAPAITSANSATFVVGTAGSFTVKASGVPAPTFSETGALPSGVTLNSTTGILGGTPASGTQGSYPIVITASNSVSPNATQNFTLTVGLAPAITSASSTTFTAGTLGTFTVTATGFPAPTFSETGALPGGVSLNSTSGVLNGNPVAGSGGTYPITITAQNGVGTNATQNFTLTVNEAPAITSANNATFAVGAAGSFTAKATGFPAPTFSETGTLPSGVSLSPSGLLSGTPASGTQGSYPITITAQNGIGTNATQNFTLTVDAAPAVTSANSTTFTVGTAGTFTVTATGLPAPTFSESGALPSGVTLNSTTGVLSGTPGAGTGKIYSITITAQNGITPNATQNFSLTVNEAPTITSATSTTFAVGSANSFTVIASGFPAPTFGESGTLPSGVTFNSTTGVLSGTPASGTQSGSPYPMTFTASNGIGSNATQNFTLNVSFTAPPSITSSNSTTFTAGTLGSFTVTATGAPAPTFSESGPLPSGVSFNTTTGVLSGTPGATSGGTYPITITAQNGQTPNATQNFTLTVDQAPAITSANSTTFTVGSSGSFQVNATGFPAPTFSETGALPTGVSLSPSGLLSGTPAAATQGSYPITITATNGVGSNATQNFTLTVNTAPSFTSSNNTTFTVGTFGTFNVTAAGTPTPSLGENGTLPSGVSFNAGTGVLSGTPTTGTGGIYSISFTASNGVNPNATQNFTLTIDEGPAITSSNSTTFTVGVSGTFTVAATGEPAATISETGSLPSGVTFTPNPSGGTATISGTPATGTAANYPLTITAHNGIGSDATLSFTLTVISDPCAIAGTGSESLLNGHYTFLLRGFDNGTTGTETTTEPALVGGVLTFNGANNNGLITAGTLDMNLNGTVGVLSRSVTGTYKVGSDHRACLSITTSGGNQHYRATLANISGGVASTGHMIDFDTSGPFTAGVLHKQDTTAFSTSKVTGNYAFEIASPQNTVPSAGGKQAAAGIIKLSNGTVTGGGFDINDEGTLDGSSSITSWPSTPAFSYNSGTSYTIDATSGRGTLTSSVTINGTPSTFQDIIYVVSAGDVLILTNFDQTQLNGLVGTGEALLQSSGSFSASSLSGTEVLHLSSLQLNGGFGSTTNPPTSDTLIGTINIPSAGNFKFSAWENNGGSISQQAPQNGTYSIDSTGRMLLTGGSGGGHPPLFYLVSSNRAFVLGSGGGVETGMFEPQSATSMSGAFAGGTTDPEDPNVGASEFAVTATGGNVNGVSDDNSNGSQNVGGTINTTYAIDSTGLGVIPTGCTAGSTTSPCKLIFYVISPARAVFTELTNNGGSAQKNPALQIADQ
jgi:hypothetical protein